MSEKGRKHKMYVHYPAQRTYLEGPRIGYKIDLARLHSQSDFVARKSSQPAQINVGTNYVGVQSGQRQGIPARTASEIKYWQPPPQLTLASLISLGNCSTVQLRLCGQLLVTQLQQ
jgi:hypothetical protein